MCWTSGAKRGTIFHVGLLLFWALCKVIRFHKIISTMNTDIDESIGNQKTMGGVTATDERSMGESDTTGDVGISLGRVDQYQLVRELGGGGFGVVYLARDTVSGIEVAVKGLPPVVKNNAEELDQIRRNFALVSRLHHPNIAAALVLHPARDVHYELEQVRQSLRVLPGDTLMVMTYAPGVTLSKWRKQFPEGRVPVNLALDICRQIASALDYAHAEKVAHRDIKPANIMVETREGSISVKVLDFGLAAEIRSSMNRVSQEKGDTSGTRPYMAPEQWAGKKQDGKTDQYALAVLFYELVSGEVPFLGAFETGDPIIMMTAVGQREPDQLPMLSAVQNSSLLRALSKTPVQRYDSCLDLWEALSGIQLSVEHSMKALGENGENIVKAVQTFNKAVTWVERLRIPHYLQVGRVFLVDLLAVVPPVSRFVDRVLGVLVEPRQSWLGVHAEQVTIWQLCKRYVLVLVAISLIPSVISAFHSNRYSSGHWTLNSMLLLVVGRYLLTLGGLYLSARIIAEVAPKFGAPKVKENAFKLVFFALTPVFLSSIIGSMIYFSLPYWLGWGYVAFLLYWGVKVLMDAEQKKVFTYTAISFALLVALYGSLGYFSRQAERKISVWSYQYQARRARDKKQMTQRTPPVPPTPLPPVVNDNQADAYFESGDIDPDSAIPPMNLPSDIWLHPKTLCTLIQREFPSGSPTNTLIVFGLDSQAELNMFCEKMKENGWRITKIGYSSKQNRDLLSSQGISASFAKAQKKATLIQRRDYSFELVVCGPDDESVSIDKPLDPAPKPVMIEPPQKVSEQPVSTAVSDEKLKQQENVLRLEEERKKQEALDAEKMRLEEEAKKVAEEQKRLDEEKAKLEETKRLVQEQKEKEEQAARAKQEEELRIKNKPMNDLKKNPMDRTELAKLKPLIQASNDPDEKCRWSIIYCLGMLAMGNTKEGYDLRIGINRVYPRQTLADLSDRGLADECNKCEGGRCKQVCLKCKGTGRCSACEGAGRGAKVGLDGQQLRCLICTGNGACRECSGTGSRSEVCKACAGRGYSFSMTKCKSLYMGLLGE